MYFYNRIVRDKDIFLKNHILKLKNNINNTVHWDAAFKLKGLNFHNRLHAKYVYFKKNHILNLLEKRNNKLEHVYAFLKEIVIGRPFFVSDGAKIEKAWFL